MLERAKHGGTVQEHVMHQTWANQLFNHQGLSTTDGRRLRLIGAGRLNHDQGPDFLSGSILLDGMELHGDIELHVESNDWFRHGHHKDIAYNGVMLHVVMDSSPCLAVRADGSIVPTLTLEGRVPQRQLEMAREKLASKDVLPCQSAAKWLSREAVRALLRDAGLERIDAKLERTRKATAASSGDWEEALWVELAAAIGGPVNGGAFRALAERLPWRILRKHAHRSLQCEALLFGAAGLLENPPWDEYQMRLTQEWKFLSSKYNLGYQHQLLKLHRMRPASFPALRLSQAAGLVTQFPCISDLMGPKGLEALRASRIGGGTYWRRNSGFGAPGAIGEKQLGQSHKAALGINVLLPFGALYMEAHGLGEAKGLFLEWLERLPPESNKVTRRYRQVGWEALNAFESQAMLHLERERCSRFGCQRCPVWASMTGTAHPGGRTCS